MSLRNSSDGTFKRGKTIVKKYNTISGKDEILLENYIPNNSTINYVSYFFRKDLVDKYTKKVNQKYESIGKESPLKNNYEIYNLDDIILNILNRPGIQTRNYSQIMESQQWIDIINYVNLLFSLTLSDICSANVNKSYVVGKINEQFNSILNSETRIPNYDSDLAIIIKSNPSYTQQFIPEFENESDEEVPSDYEEEYESSIGSESESDADIAQSEILRDTEFKLKHRILDEITNKFREIDINFGSHEEQLEAILSKSVAFVNVVRNECNIYKNDYVLSLICSKPGVGSILLGLYLYCLLSRPIIPLDGSDAINDYDLTLTGKGVINYKFAKKPKSFKQKYKDEYKYGVRIYSEKFRTNDDLIATNGMAILEIANAYTNYAGLCAYQKFGFKYDKQLFSKRRGYECMTDARNLPMSINFREESPDNCYSGLTMGEKRDKVLNIVCGINTTPCQRHRICNEPDDVIKKLIAVLNNIIMYQDGMMMFKNITDKKINLNDITTRIGNLHGNVLKIINTTKPSRTTNYDYITNILSLPIDDPKFLTIINKYRQLISPKIGGNKRTGNRRTRNKNKNKLKPKNSKTKRFKKI